MWPQLPICALNPHFYRCTNTAEAGSIPEIFISFAWFFFYFCLMLFESLFRYVAGSVSYVFSPSSSLNLLRAFCCSGCSNVFDRDIKLAVTLLFYLHSHPFCLGFRKVSNVLLVITMCCCFWSRWWSFGRIIKMTGRLLLLLGAAVSIGEAALPAT